MSAKAKATSATPEFLKYWTKVNSCTLLVALTVACLLPFANRAFHVDDPLFVWSAKQIVKSPGNPYGFDLIWDYTRVQMSDVTQNPPLAAYYLAAIGKVAGWEERPLHLGFLVVAVVLLLGTYRLAGRFTKFPLLAALATLLTPGLLVSASSVMCDTMMLAFWVWAMAFWVEGLESEGHSERPGHLLAAALLISAAFVTKYFAASLIVLLFVYSILRLRRAGRWMLYLLIPVATIWGYQRWSVAMYGQGLLSRAAVYTEMMRVYLHPSWTARALMALSFTGGCALAPLLFAPIIWPRWKSLIALLVSSVCAVALLWGWVRLGHTTGGPAEFGVWKQHGVLLGVQWTLLIAGGIAVLSLLAGDIWAQRAGKFPQDSAGKESSRESIADSWLLGLWVLGTFVFAGFVNWTVNARSILPLIPAAAILLTRRSERRLDLRTKNAMGVVALALIACGALSVWVATGDTELANTARRNATLVYQKTLGQGNIWFEGHWGFQYYMQLLGAQPLDLKNPQAQPGDFIVIPFNNYWTPETPPYQLISEQRVFLPMHTGATTISWPLGAGFYSTYWGPMPFAIGPEPLEGARILQLGARTVQ